MDILQSKSNSFTVLSLNCQSLNAKFDQLKIYLFENYNEHSIKINMLCLQETWLTADSDLSQFQIDGYNLISTGKSCSTHGGVAIYLHHKFNYNIIELTNSDLWDGQFLEVLIENEHNENKKVIVGNIYCPTGPLVENIYK